MSGALCASANGFSSAGEGEEGTSQEELGSGRRTWAPKTSPREQRPSTAQLDLQGGVCLAPELSSSKSWEWAQLLLTGVPQLCTWGPNAKPPRENQEALRGHFLNMYSAKEQSKEHTHT